MTFVQSLFGRHAPEAKLTVCEQLIVWLIALGGVLIGLVVIPAGAFYKVSHDLAVQQYFGQTPILTTPHEWILALSLLFAVVLSTLAGGILKMATANSPIQWSAYALLASLSSLAAAAYILGEARSVFSASGADGAAWVMPWLGTIVVLLGWTLKAPWDRCAQIVSDETTKRTGWLSKPDVFTMAVTSRAAALPLVAMRIPKQKDRKAPLEKKKS